ncbi:hypothetical protein [Comamonas sp.]|uniref:hypothetical protein n=1 Tax=Comamonas sp. TaxID=34028 RepID=UPI002899F856|nr:hypothetical protein [Comamonas sp.]
MFDSLHPRVVPLIACQSELLRWKFKHPLHNWPIHLPAQAYWVIFISAVIGVFDLNGSEQPGPAARGCSLYDCCWL